MVVAALAVVVWAATLSVIDMRHRRLPNSLTLPGAMAILAVAAGQGRGPAALAGALALAGMYLIVHLAAPAAMGAGDVKLALGLGALTAAFGPDVWALAAMGAPLVTALIGLARRRGGPVPHGPAMCLASLAAAAVAIL